LKHLPVISGNDAIRVLTRAGFSFVRQKGSHVRMKKQLPDTTLNVTIPIHDELDRTTLRSIIKAAEISEEEFLHLLE
jgi:predicted RNA binding protein YcfA (HicA-like mRNA interferase family)